MQLANGIPATAAVLWNVIVDFIEVRFSEVAEAGLNVRSDRDCRCPWCG